MRTAVLLGAGASRDAGMPLTNDLADELVTRMNAVVGRRSQAALLNFVYGAMLGQVTQAGGDPHTAVNVETMFSAIRVLRDRERHEVTPFVQQWNPSVVALDLSESPSDFSIGTGLKEGIEKALDGKYAGNTSSLVRAIRSVVQEELGASGDGSGYRKLELQLRELIVTVLTDRLDSGRLDYLAPVVRLAREQSGGADVISLNYDLTIEKTAEQLGIPVNRGIENWRPGEDLPFEPVDGRLNLVKPHGSVDWVVDTLNRDGVGLPQRYTRERDDQFATGGPAVVIGDREKLETEGATLALLRGFEAVLRRSDRLVVIGYSGADAHVNALIRDWANADDARTIVVVDPGWPTGAAWPSSFRDELTGRLGSSVDPTMIPPRLVVVRKDARTGIPEALAATPLVDPAKWFEVESQVAGTTVELTITNLGHDLGQTTFYPRALGPTGDARKWPERIQVLHPEAVVSPNIVDSIAIPQLKSGEQVVVRLEFANDANTSFWFMRIAGSRPIGQVLEQYGGSDNGPVRV